MSQVSWRGGLHACALIEGLESSTNNRFAKPVGITHSTAGELGIESASRPTHERKEKKKEKGLLRPVSKEVTADRTFHRLRSMTKCNSRDDDFIS